MVSGKTLLTVPEHASPPRLRWARGGVPRLLATLLVALLAVAGAAPATHAEDEPGEPSTAATTEDDATTDDSTEEPSEEETYEPATAAQCGAIGDIEDRNEDALAIIGRVCDRRVDPQVGVPNVRIVITDAAGEEVAEARTAGNGTFSVDIPGDPEDVLGDSYTAAIDEETLPEETAPDVQFREVTFNLLEDQSVTFPVGPAGPEATGKLTQALQLAVGGLVFAVLLAMAALGLSMIFGTTGLTNFSHGELVTFGALVAFGIDRLPGTIELFGLNVTVIVAVIAAFVVSALFGWVNDAGLWRPLRGRGTSLVAMMIVSIGLSIFLRNIYQYVGGAEAHTYSQYASVAPWEVGPLLLTPKAVIVTIFGVAVLGVVTSLLRFTRTGKAMRAVADNPALASATGINVERVVGIVWIGGAALAGLSGALLGLTQGFDYQTGFKILLLIFAAVILGGLGTVWGAIVGAFIIAMMTELSTLFVSAEFKFVGALLVLIVVLLFRPQGLLGRAQRVG